MREGQSNPEGSEPLLYVGTALEVDAASDASVRDDADQLAELLQPFRTPDGTVWRFAEKGIVERYEALDTNTGKMCVMWRAPFRSGEE